MRLDYTSTDRCYSDRLFQRSYSEATLVTNPILTANPIPPKTLTLCLLSVGTASASRDMQ